MANSDSAADDSIDYTDPDLRFRSADGQVLSHRQIGYGAVHGEHEVERIEGGYIVGGTVYQPIGSDEN
jgi:hypothetical protein